MMSVSNAFNEAFKQPTRQVLARITMNDITYTNNDVFSVSYEGGSIVGEGFNIGSTFSNSIKITFAKIIEGVKQLDKIKLEFGIVLADGTSEYVSMGYFFVSSYDPDRNENRTTIEAYDAMSQMEGLYESGLTYPATLLAVATEIVNKSGMTIDTPSFQRLPNKSITKISGKTYRQAIGMIAQFAGGFVIFDRSGKLSIRTLNDPNFSVSTADYFSKGLSKDETMYKLDGINCKVKTSDSEESTLQSGVATGNQISLENDVMTQIYLDDIYQQLKNLNYYPFSLSWRGNPALEAGDWISMADTKANSFKMPNLSYKLEFSGGLKATSSAETKSIASSTVQFQGTLKQKVSELEGWKNASGGWTYAGIAEPINPQEGDVWFKPNGPDTETWIFENGKWIFKTSTAGITEAKQAAAEAKELGEEAKQAGEEAKVLGNEALVAGNNAVEKATKADSNASTALTNANSAVDQATQASQKADNSVITANEAKTQAANAVTNANTALANANKAISDVGTLSEDVSELDTIANQAKSDASTALTNANKGITDAKTALDKATGVDTRMTTEITTVNNTLATKANSSTVDALSSTVSSQGTAISQNASDIKVKADSTVVNAIKGTVDSHGTLISQNASDIKIKANQSSVDTLTGRVSATEASLTLQDGKITTLTTKTDGLDTSLTSLTQDYNGFKGTVYTKSQTDTKITTVQASVDQFKTTVSNTYSTKTETQAIKKSVDSLGTNIAYAWSEDGTDRFTRVKPNENLILGSDASSKSGFFKNFDLVKDGYGEVTMTSAKTYRSIDLREGYSVGIRDYPVGAKVRISFEIMYTAWNFPSGTNRAEFWLGQRYTSGPSGSTGNWRGVTTLELPAVGDNGRVLNTWYPVTAIFTIPEQASEGVGDACVLQFYNSSTTSASFTVRIRKPKMEYGWDQTIYTTNPQDDYDNSTPRYIGRSLKDSSNASDYTWEVNSDRKPWTGYLKELDGTGFSKTPYGKNLVLASSSPFVMTGNNTSNQTQTMYLFEDNKKLLDIVNASNPVAKISYDFEITGSNRIGTFHDQTNNTPWAAFGNINMTENSGHVERDLVYSKDWTNALATGFAMRMDGASGTLTIKNFKVELGPVATPWTPAPSEDPLGAIPKYVGTAALPYEDPYKYEWRLSSDWNEVKTSTSIDQTNKAIILKADQTTVNEVTGRVSTVEGKITLLSDRMNFRITNSDGSITQIDLANKVISLSGDQVNITGNTYIANGVIKTANIADLAVSTAKIADLAVTDAKISSLTANKLTAGTIDANVITVKNISASNITGGTMTADRINGGTINGGNVNIINLNANNITSGTISGTNLSIDLANGVVNFQKGSITSTNGTLDIQITTGTMGVYNTSGDGVTFSNGYVYLTKKSSGMEYYGSIKYAANLFSYNNKGISIVGNQGITLKTSSFDDSAFYPFTRFTGAGISATESNSDNNSSMLIASKDIVSIYGGKLRYPNLNLSTPARILVGVDSNASPNVSGNGILIECGSDGIHLKGPVSGGIVPSSNESIYDMKFIWKVGGTSYAELTTYSGAWGITAWSSDRNLKKNISTQNDSALSVVDQLKIKQFDWKEGGKHVDFGLIAQEVETVLPDAVFSVTQPNGEQRRQLKSEAFVPLLLKSIQELKQEIE
ncbi:tail fiber domain-containing protein, partial [uncultured Enterococcus sp.]|uniref:tail fiber domain-containing protein n=1 Tax=uncultured Enterococcus sp. TaxID=167972 RepID=UPI002592897E